MQVKQQLQQILSKLNPYGLINYVTVDRRLKASQRQTHLRLSLARLPQLSGLSCLRLYKSEFDNSFSLKEFISPLPHSLPFFLPTPCLLRTLSLQKSTDYSTGSVCVLNNKSCAALFPPLKHTSGANTLEEGHKQRSGFKACTPIKNSLLLLLSHSAGRGRMPLRKKRKSCRRRERHFPL